MAEWMSGWNRRFSGKILRNENLTPRPTPSQRNVHSSYFPTANSTWRAWVWSQPSAIRDWRLSAYGMTKEIKALSLSTMV